MNITRFALRRWKAVALLLIIAMVIASLIQHYRGPVVDVMVVQAQPLEQRVVASGRVSSASRVRVGSEVAGTVLERRVDEGDHVRPGDVLVRIQADELAANLRNAQARLEVLERNQRPQAQARLQDALAQVNQAERELQRRNDLARQQLIAREDAENARQNLISARTIAEQARSALQALSESGAEIAEARATISAAQAALDKATVRSQVAGTVLTRSVEPGDMVQPGSLLFDIASDGPTELHVPVDEKNLQVLAVGQPAQAIADAWPQHPFPATVGYIAPSIDPTRGSVEVRLYVDPVPDFLRQDLTVSVSILSARKEHALVVPNTALIAARNQRYTIWTVRDGVLVNVPVTLGLRGTASSEVVDGLSAGEQVLIDPSPTTSAGQRVRTRIVSITDDTGLRQD